MALKKSVSGLKYDKETFYLSRPEGPFAFELYTPQKFVGDVEPAILLLCGAEPSLDGPLAPTAAAFLSEGRRVLSFELPCFGSRVTAFGQGPGGLCASFMAERDPFGQFVRDGMAVIDHLMDQYMAVPGRVFVAGYAEGAYMAARLMAADLRVGAGAFMSPVVDWRMLPAFQEFESISTVEGLCLTNYREELVGRPMFLCVGNHDDRVGTHKVCEFYLSMFYENAQNGYDNAALDFFATRDQGHGLYVPWYERAGRFLIEFALL